MQPRILIVEDELAYQVILRDNLEYEGYQVSAVSTAEEALALAARIRPDLVLLDVMLPRMSGYEACKRLRGVGFSAPIIMLTARNTELDRITGLEIGADDYIGKPFSVRELVTRVHVQLRRRAAENPSHGWAGGGIEVNFKTHEVRRDGQEVRLSALEYQLLRYFIDHRGEVVSRDRLLAEVWGYHSLPLTRTVDNFVAKLRKKLEPAPHCPGHILTVHGSGYRFLDHDES